MQKSSGFKKLIFSCFCHKNIFLSQYLIKTLHIGEKLKNNVSELGNLVLLVISSSSYHFPLVWTEIVPGVVVAAGVLQ